MGLETDLKQLAARLGFTACHITPVDAPWLAGARLRHFVEAGYHGEMDWMETTLERRSHPNAMWSEAKSAVMVGLNYGPDADPMGKLQLTGRANISVYAQGKDYHDVLKKRLKTLARTFAKDTGEAVKVFVDTAPLMEKPLAQKAGLGWQGKHTNLVSRRHGSWLFLGAMLTTARLQADPEETDHCGSCTACLDICPTDAFPAPYQLDARRCISYLTIEHKGAIPVPFRLAMGNRIYGCDDCLAVCPWNKYARQAQDSAFWARAELKIPRLSDLAVLDDNAFRQVFSGSPIKRIGRQRFVRNVLIALGNSGNRACLDVAILPLIEDPSPLIRGAAIWALGRLDPVRFGAEKALRYGGETDVGVQSEWRHNHAQNGNG